MTINLRWIAPATLVLAVAAGAVVWLAGGTRPASAASTATAAPRAALSVNLTTPQRQTWPTQLLADGNLAAWQEAVVSAQTGSLRIATLLADVGQQVHRGQLLATLDDQNLQASLAKQNAAIATAQANLQQAQANVQRARAVGSSGALSSKSIDDYASAEATSQAALASAQADLQATRIQLAQTRIVAVDDGYVSSRSALLGNVVPAGTELFRLVRQGRVEWHAEVDAQRLNQVRVGQTVAVSLPGGRKVAGRVRLIAPTLSTSTNRATVYVALPVNDTTRSGAAPGMFASGTIQGADTPALTLPQSAIVPRDGRSDVFVLKADGSVTRQTVVTGRRQGDRVELLSGPAEGTQVVASGGAFLAEGVKVAVVGQPPSTPSIASTAGTGVAR